MKKYLLIIGFLLTSFVSFSQVIPKPNPTAVGIGYKRLLADSTIFIPTGGAIPRLGSNNINRRSAIYADTINKRLWVFYPNDSTWKVAGLTKITWDSVTNKPTYFLTKYDSSTDIKDSIQARLALRDTANMLSPYIKIVDVHGLPVGGTTGQILAKIDETDYNTQWIDNYTGDIRQYVKAGEAINKGQAVYVSSADGTNIIVSKASNASESTSSKTLGLLYQTLALNGQGFVITEGRLEGLNTLGATAGDPVWLGTNGNLIFGLANKPYAPAHLVYIGVVSRVNANNGEILVKIQNGFELKELHDVSAQSPSNNDGIFYNSSNSLWETKSIATALGYTPANAATYVPYTGATTDVDLGNHNLSANYNITSKNNISGRSVYVDGSVTNNEGSILGFKQYPSTFGGDFKVTALSALNNNSLGLTYWHDSLPTGQLRYKSISLRTDSLTINVGRTYYWPNVSGTLALLEGTQTFSGLKTFSNSTTNFNNPAANGINTLTFKSASVTDAIISIDTNFTQFQSFGNYGYLFKMRDGSNGLAIRNDGSGFQLNLPFSGSLGLFSSFVRASAYKLSGMEAGSGALYWTSDRVTLANYNATGVVHIEANGGTGVATFGGATYNNDFVGTGRFTGALTGTSATLSSDLTVNGEIISNNYLRLAAGFAIANNMGVNSRADHSNISVLLSPGQHSLMFWTNTDWSSKLVFTPSANRTFTFPNASGTIALTSDLGSYLPLVGGILTGKLAGVNLEFSNPSAPFVSGGVINSSSTQTIAVPNGSTWSNGSVFSASNNTQILNFAGSQSIQNGSVVAGTVNVNRISFTAGSSTISMAQSTGIRAMAGMQMLQQTGGTINGTVSHGASMFVQGVYPSNTANVTFSNYYGLLMNPLDEWGGVTFTNRWGIYQSGASDKNYFNGNLLVKSTTDNGSALQVTGAATFSSSVTAGQLIAGGGGSTGGAYAYLSTSVNGLPATSGTTQTAGALRLRGGDNAVLDFGLNSVDTWLQATDLSSLGTYYKILLNPRGGNVGVGMSNPDQKFTINQGATGTGQGIPATSGTTQNGILRLRPAVGVYGETFDFGMNVASTYAWMQATNASGLGTNYAIAINPNGGNVLIGTSTDNGVDKLQVNGTIAATSLKLGGDYANTITTTTGFSSFQTLIPTGVLAPNALYVIYVNYSVNGGPYNVTTSFTYIPCNTNGGGVDNTFTPMTTTHQGGTATMDVRSFAGSGQPAAGLQLRINGVNVSTNGSVVVRAIRLQ